MEPAVISAGLIALASGIQEEIDKLSMIGSASSEIVSAVQQAKGALESARSAALAASAAVLL